MTARPQGILAVIPARAGSRRISSKNTQQVAGRPMIAWSIDAARHAPSIDRVVVSTDSDAIAEIARDAGAEVPALRPAALAQDDTDGTEPILQMVERLEAAESYTPQYVIVLQPTSPLRTVEDVENAVNIVRRIGALSVVSVCRAGQPTSWMRRLGPDGELLALDSACETASRDHATEVFVLNGAIYLVERETMLRRRSLYADTTYAYVMPVERSIDVDTSWDLHLVDLALRFPFVRRA